MEIGSQIQNGNQTSPLVSIPASSTKLYRQEGDLEAVPADSNVPFITNHERRRLNGNRLDSLAKGTEVEQSVAYRVSLSEGKPAITRAVTRSIQEQSPSDNNFPKIRVQETGSPENLRRLQQAVQVRVPTPDSGGDGPDNPLDENLVRLKLSKQKLTLEILTTDNGKAGSERNSPLSPAEKPGLAGSQPVQETSNNRETDGTSGDREKLVQKLKDLENRIKKLSLEKRFSEAVTGFSELRKEIRQTLALLWGGALSGGDRNLPGGDAADFPVETSPYSDIPKEEFAQLSDIDKIIANSFRFIRRQVPPVLLFDGGGSAEAVRSDLDKLKGFQDRSPIQTQLAFGERFLQARDDALSQLGAALGRLANAAQALSNREDFNVNVGNSSGPAQASVDPGFGSATGTFSLVVDRLARSDQLVSSAVSDPNSALGLSGSFRVNGYVVTVSSSDSLVDLRDKINRGEDANENGQLDGNEDLNGNGTLDSFQIPGVLGPNGFLPAVNVFEDVDADRVLDGSEDANGNELLDGGTDAIGLKASIRENKLVLTSLQSGDNSVRIDDPNGILQSLGYLQELKTGRITTKPAFEDDLIVQPTTAQGTLNSEAFTRGDNSINDLIGGSTVDLKKASSDEISLSIDRNASAVLDRFSNFVDAFNSVISLINDQTLSLTQLGKNERVQNIHTELVANATANVESRTSAPQSIRDIGIDLNTGGFSPINQLSVENLLRDLQSDLAASVPRGQGSLFERLDKLGVTGLSDLTLSINNNQLNEALVSDPVGVQETFSGLSDSVIQRITDRLQEYLAPQVGTVGIERSVISFYQENSLAANQIVQTQGGGFSSTVQSRTQEQVVGGLSIRA